VTDPNPQPDETSGAVARSTIFQPYFGGAARLRRLVALFRGPLAAIKTTVPEPVLRLLPAPPLPGRTADEGTSPSAGDPLFPLLEPALAGERSAERALLIAVGPGMLGVVRRVLGAQSPDLDDVCQDALLSFLGALPGFRGECTIRNFASRVALITAFGARRRARWRTLHESLDEAEAEAALDPAPTPADRVEASRRRSAARALLEELPMLRAEALGLHLALGYTVSETATMMGTPVDTVRSRVRRGLTDLRDRLLRRPKLRDLVGGKS
jgi:RNA polymerase sigma factor (sigma-70 family)